MAGLCYVLLGEVPAQQRGLSHDTDGRQRELRQSTEDAQWRLLLRQQDAAWVSCRWGSMPASGFLHRCFSRDMQ